MLKAEKRHTKACRASEYDRNVKKCRCPYRAVGMLNGVFVRKALKTSSEEESQKIIRRWEGDGQPDEPKDRVLVTIPQVVTAYLDDAKARNLSDATQSKLKTIFEKQVLGFCESKGFRFLTQVADVNVIRDFRATWKDAPLARSKKQDRIVGFSTSAIVAAGSR